MTVCCPKCGSQIGIASIKSEFVCSHCNQHLTSNFNEILAVVGIVFLLLILVNSVAFYGLFGFSKLVTLGANLLVALETAVFYVFWIGRKIQLHGQS